jgi:hypothetical protein
VFVSITTLVINVRVMTLPHGHHYCRHKTQQQNGTCLRKFTFQTAVVSTNI